MGVWMPSKTRLCRAATAAVLGAIYEEEFLGFSYGFRPKRNQHDALDALMVGISGTKVNFGRGRRHQGLLGCRVILPPGLCGLIEEGGLLS